MILTCFWFFALARRRCRKYLTDWILYCSLYFCAISYFYNCN